MSEIYQKQKAYFASGKTLDVRWRIQQLQSLYDLILKKEKALASHRRRRFDEYHPQNLCTVVMQM